MNAPLPPFRRIPWPARDIAVERRDVVVPMNGQGDRIGHDCPQETSIDRAIVARIGRLLVGHQAKAPWRKDFTRGSA